MTANTRVTEVEAVIVGGGMTGIRATIALKREGVRRIAVLEKGDQLGGVWHHNRYPGVACDIPAPTYSFSLKPNDWSRLYANGDELREYFQQVAAENDVSRHVRFNTELLDASWDDRTSRWVCETTNGTFRSRFLILATGVLHERLIPRVRGRETFTGTMFHSSEWPDDFDPTGRRIAVVGTGASAIQFVPAIQPHAESLAVLQRTPPWILPKFDVVHKQVSERRALRRQKILRAVLRASLEMLLQVTLHARLSFLLGWLPRKHLRDSVADPELRAVLTPDYRVNCKRLLLSSDFYPAITSENVAYAASGLAEIRENSVITADGREFEVDTIIYGTGFSYGQQVLERVRGRDGKPMAAAFAGSPRTYRATTMVGCPNAFILCGPNAGTASIPFAAEAQARYVASAIKTMRRRALETVEVRPEAEAAWMRHRDRRFRGSVWNAGGCQSYYLNDQGENVAAWPGSMRNMARKLRSFDVDNYLVTTRKSSVEQIAPVTDTPLRESV